jgi:hypothetical protein
MVCNNTRPQKPIRSNIFSLVIQKHEMSGQDWDTVTFTKKTKAGAPHAPLSSLKSYAFRAGAADQRTAEQARMSGMQVETVRKAVSNSTGAGGVSLGTLRRAEDDDGDAPMKCGALAFCCSIVLPEKNWCRSLTVICSA